MSPVEPEYSLDEINECLWRKGQRIDLTPKAFRVAQYLCRQVGLLATKQALLDAVWPDTHVTEAVLSVAIAQLREALQDNPKQPRFIETVHRRGYRWIGPLGARHAAAKAELTAPDLAPLTSATTIVGREPMLAALHRARTLAEAGTRQLVFVTGEPGIGKSALVDAFLAELHPPEQVSLGRGQCVEQYGQGEPYMPVIEAMEALCRDGEVQRVLRSHAPTWVLQMPGVASAEESAELRRTLAGSTSERMMRELSNALSLLTSQRLFVLVFEDVHWADHATVALLAALAQRREPARLLLLATYRSVDAIVAEHPIVALKRQLAPKRLCVELALEGLGVEAIASYLSSRFPANSFSRHLCEIIQAQTTGNPLFLQNAVDDFVQNGWIREQDGLWTCSVSEDTVREAVPAAARDLLEQRFERLPPQTREILEAASAVGMTFSSQTVAAALEMKTAELEDLCVQLVRSGQFIEPAPSSTWPDGSHAAGFVFRHALYRQVLYSRLAPARRVVIHRRIGERLEAGHGARAAEISNQLAIQYERGGEPLRAAYYCRKAAWIALGRYATDEAIELLRRGLGLLDTLPESRVRNEIELQLRTALVTPLIDKEGTATAELQPLANRVRDLTDRDRPTLKTMQALGALVAFHISRGRFGDASDLVREELGLVHADPALGPFEPMIRFQIGFIDLAGGRFETAIGNLTSAVDLPSMVPLAPIEISLAAAANIALARFVLGDPDTAMSAARVACTRAEELGHPFTNLYVWWRVQQIAELALDVSLAATAAERIGEIADRTGFALWRGIASMASAWVRAARGEGAPAVEEAREGMRIVSDCGHEYWLPARSATLANGLLRLGRIDDARVTLHAAVAYIERSGERWYQAEIHRLEAETDVAEGRTDDAEASFRTAIGVARGQRAKWFELKASLGLARLWQRQRPAEARDLLSGAYGLLSEGFGLPEMREARALLRAIGET